MITSVSNKRITKAVRLKKRAMREKDRRFLVEGTRAVAEAVVSGAAVHEIFVTREAGEKWSSDPAAAGFGGVPVRLVSEEVMRHLTSTVTPQGMVAVAEFVDVSLSAIADDARCVPVLVRVRDPGNAGTILRSADAAGADAVVFTDASVDVYNPKTVRATAGSLFHMPVVRETPLDRAVEELKARGFSIYTATADGESSVYDVDLAGRSAVLFGNEAQGLDEQASVLSDATLRVPIAGKAESLNVAAAATLIMFESARQRGAGPSLASVVAGAAHDIRSPLAALRGFLSTLSSRWDRLTDDERRMMVDAMQHDSSRMAVLVTQLVDASRVISGSVDLSLDATDVVDVVWKVQLETSRWVAAGVTLARRPDDAAVVLADPQRLRTILVGMIEAAAWYGAEGPVTIAVTSGPPVVVEVARSGSMLGGVPRSALFAPAVPGSSKPSKIGLFVAKGLADAHGATLVADSGDDFRLRLAFPQSASSPYLPPGGAS